jgi:hypothetical protein
MVFTDSAISGTMKEFPSLTDRDSASCEKAAVAKSNNAASITVNVFFILFTSDFV